MSFYQLIKNWLLVYIGNFIGALGVLLLIYLSNHWSTEVGALGAKAILIANSKVNLTWMEDFSRWVQCNILVCMLFGFVLRDGVLPIKLWQLSFLLQHL